MSILVGALEFEEPVADLDLLSEEAGVFGILCRNGEELELVEFGEAEFVRGYVQSIKDRWRELEILVAVHYTGDLEPAERQEIVTTLEQEFNAITRPPEGQFSPVL